MSAVQSQTTPMLSGALIAKYDSRAPRYTSYPTAAQFTPDVTAETYRTWLGKLDPADPVSLYLHVPFCARLCWYCGCNTRAVNRHAPVGDYVDHLLLELGLLEHALPGRMKAASLHLGGGTPNMLSADDLANIFGALRHVFDVSADAEVAAELDPDVLTQDWVRAAAFHGLSRASLGVQSLAPEVQAAVNRNGGFDHLVRCMAWLREAGVRSINLDLMYGLPNQTLANTLATLDQLLPLRPERLALFGYAHVPWMKAHQRLIDPASLPGAAARLEQSEAAAERLIAEGYVRIGLDHFALPTDDLAKAQAEGRLRRNFQGYTTDPAQTLLGLGASAIGNLRQGLVQNVTDERKWRAALASGALPVARGALITTDDRFRGEIIERLMCDFHVDLGAICARHGRALDDVADAWARLADFEHDGLVVLDGARVVVPPRGRLLIRSICAVFDVYFSLSAERHAKAL